jgi:hypothetical protein
MYLSTRPGRRGSKNALDLRYRGVERQLAFPHFGIFGKAQGRVLPDVIFALLIG